MSITSRIDRNKDLTIFKVTGVLSFDMAFPVVKAFYDADPTSHVLWDLIDTTDIEFTTEEVLEIVNLKPRFHGKRKSGKTAFVAQKDILFGLSRMFEIQSGIQEAPYAIKVFRSLYEAHQWLFESGPFAPEIPSRQPTCETPSAKPRKNAIDTDTRDDG